MLLALAATLPLFALLSLQLLFASSLLDLLSCVVAIVEVITPFELYVLKTSSPKMWVFIILLMGFF